MKKLFNILVLFFALSNFSCERNVEEPFNCDTQISYSEDIRPIIDNNCMQCHNGEDNSIPDWSTYEEIFSKADKIQELTLKRIMPKEGSLTNNEIKAIYCWVEQGALQN